jgi:hypothetical protein
VSIVLWLSGPIYYSKMDQDGHGQHGHGKILLKDAVNCKIQLPIDFFLRPAIDRSPGSQIDCYLQKQTSPKGSRILQFRASLSRILPWPAILATTILVRFGVVY